MMADVLSPEIFDDPEDYDPAVPFPTSKRGHVFVTRLGKRLCRDCSVPETADFAQAESCPGAKSDYICSKCQTFVPENAPCPYCHQ